MNAKTNVVRLLLWLLLVLPAAVQAQFIYVTNDNQITITIYTGNGSAVTIPDTINGLPVTTIEGFYGCSSLTSFTIPNSVTNLVAVAFPLCSSLRAINVAALNPVYSSVDGVLFDKSQTRLIKYPAVKTGSYTIPNSVTTIEASAFRGCARLTSVTIPNNVTNLGSLAFLNCTRLAEVYFEGNAPSVGLSVFAGANNSIIYFLPGTTGWTSTFADRPAVLWNPQIQTGEASFGVKADQFGFNVTGTRGLTYVVEATTDLTQPVWTPVSTETLTGGTDTLSGGSDTLSGGSAYFSDPQWQNYPSRLYRLRMP